MKIENGNLHPILRLSAMLTFLYKDFVSRVVIKVFKFNRDFSKAEYFISVFGITAVNLSRYYAFLHGSSTMNVEKTY